MITCKECRHWKRLTGKHDKSFHGEYAGECSSEKFRYNGEGPTQTARDEFTYWDYEGYAAGFHTGENFGCIHWEKAH